MIWILKKNFTKFFWLLHKLFDLWIKVKFIPSNPKEELHLRSDIPTVYVLPNNSLSDKLVLYSICKKLQLPLPTNIDTNNIFNPSSYKEGFCLALNKFGILQAIHTQETPPKFLITLFNEIRESYLSKDVQLIPVTIIWGRDPGKIQDSWFKLLFNDDENAGFLQKFFIILAQGKDVFLHFGAPISIKEQIQNKVSYFDLIKRLREHYKNQRQIVLGPKLYDRNTLIAELFKSEAIQELINIEEKKSKQKRSKIEAQVLRYLKEISASQNYSTLRFLNLVLTYVLKKLFIAIETQNIQQIREISQTHSLIYVPAHRSYFDFLTLPYQLYHNGLKTPHFAAGINLNFWPVGGLLRKGGAFFIRRSFKGNKLYAKVLYEYINTLLKYSYPICFFPEGQRSRIGKSLEPKTGMLSMIVQSYLRDKTKPIAFVPVYIGYDNVIEIKSYLKELGGQKKQSESFWQFLKVTKIFKRQYGKVYINFAPPIFLDEFLKAHYPQQETINFHTEQKPLWYINLIQKLAHKIMEHINYETTVTPTSLIGSILTSLPQKSLPEQEMHTVINNILILIKNSIYKDKEYLIPLTNSNDIIHHAEKYSHLKRFNYPGSDILYLEEIDAIKMLYYKNNIMHLLAIPSIIASCFKYTETRTLEDIIQISSILYEIIKHEFFLKEDNIKSLIQLVIDIMLELEILKLTSNKDYISRPSILSSDFLKYKIISSIFSTTIQKYCIAFLILSNLAQKYSKISLEKFSQHCDLIFTRISLLEGIPEAYMYNPQTFSKLFEYLKSLNYINALNVEENSYTITDKAKLVIHTLEQYVSEEFLTKISKLH